MKNKPEHSIETAEREAIKESFTDNGNGTISFNGYVTLDTSSQVTNLAVMALRGFPNGIPLDKPERDCEKMSPGIVNAQANARGKLMLLCTVTIDVNGNRTVKLK